jgi:hypothetical protein
MSDETTPPPLSPAVEARFKALATSVPDADWEKLVAGSTDAVLRRLSGCGALDGASPEALETGYKLVGQLLVDYTNVVLTLVAGGLEAKEGAA